MCLTTVDKKITTTHGVGYKLVLSTLRTYRDNGISHVPVQLKVDKWVHDLHPLEKLIGHERYKPGFHLFLSEKDARYVGAGLGWTNAIVVKVRFHHVVAQGTQLNRTVIVARCIKMVKNDS